MKKFVLICLFTVALLTVFADDAEARRRGRRYRVAGYSGTGSHMTYTPTTFSTEKRLYDGTVSLQDVAMMRAKWMAHYGVLSHSIESYHKDCPQWQGHGATGEGIGMSYNGDYKQCATCIVGSVVVADGWCKSKKNGMIYRCRLFK
jgi:hypothetical protein